MKKKSVNLVQETVEKDRCRKRLPFSIAVFFDFLVYN